LTAIVPVRNPPAPPPPPFHQDPDARPAPPPPPPATTRYSAKIFGVTELLAELAKDVPLVFVATAVNVYAVPFVKPVTIIGLDEPVAVMLPGDDVIVYPVMLEPPVAFAENSTDTWPDAPVAVAELIVGA
jgi:hypothetical protein